MMNPQSFPAVILVGNDGPMYDVDLMCLPNIGDFIELDSPNPPDDDAHDETMRVVRVVHTVSDRRVEEPSEPATHEVQIDVVYERLDHI
jgi:hypothetical protein